jgi:hypothetical protein
MIENPKEENRLTSEITIVYLKILNDGNTIYLPPKISGLLLCSSLLLFFIAKETHQ